MDSTPVKLVSKFSRSLCPQSVDTDPLSSLASSLGISRIIIHRFSSILSAYGLALADRVHEVQE